MTSFPFITIFLWVDLAKTLGQGNVNANSESPSSEDNELNELPAPTLIMLIYGATVIAHVALAVPLDKLVVLSLQQLYDITFE